MVNIVAAGDLTPRMTGMQGHQPHYIRASSGNQMIIVTRHPTQVSFLAAFAKLRKVSISFVTYVCPHGTTLLPLDGFLSNSTFETFKSLSRKFKFH